MEDKITNLIEDTIASLGYELVKVSCHGGKHKVVEILVDRLDNKKITLSDCRLLSNNISALLDVENLIKEKYYLEVSSAGVERPLIHFEDYQKFVGNHIKVKLKEKIADKLKYIGKIIKAENNEILLSVENKKLDEEVIINFDNIKNANLHLTDELFKQLLNKK
ncbi:MAG: ribosome maturation factor RimP [Rickettsiaceae bacterium]|nr:ribosome maturation factor RimP [Rickettsiaceae bacterium]